MDCVIPLSVVLVISTSMVGALPHAGVCNNGPQFDKKPCFPMNPVGKFTCDHIYRCCWSEEDSACIQRGAHQNPHKGTEDERHLVESPKTDEDVRYQDIQVTGPISTIAATTTTTTTKTTQTPTAFTAGEFNTTFDDIFDENEGLVANQASTEEHRYEGDGHSISSMSSQDGDNEQQLKQLAREERIRLRQAKQIMKRKEKMEQRKKEKEEKAVSQKGKKVSYETDPSEDPNHGMVFEWSSETTILGTGSAERKTEGMKSVDAQETPFMH